MLKFLLLVVVGVVVVWMFTSRSRVRPPVVPKSPPRTPPSATTPDTMLACVHCGVHLPQADAVQDAGGRPYCSEAHRLAGPR